MLAHLCRGPCPELCRHHLGHVAAEAVDALRCPVEQYVEHLLPGVGQRVEVAHSAGVVVDAVVQLDGLVPVVASRCVVEAVVAGGLRGCLRVWLRLAMIEVEVGREALSGTVVEVVLRVEALRGVVALAEVADALGLADAVVLSCHVVGHEVDDHLQSCTVCAVDQLLELVHALPDVDGQVGVDVVVVDDGVGRARASLHHGRVLARYAVAAVVGHGGVAYDACVPDVADAHLAYLLQHRGCEVVELADPVLFDGSKRFSRRTAVTVQARKYLVDDDFTRCHERSPLY